MGRKTFWIAVLLLFASAPLPAIDGQPTVRIIVSEGDTIWKIAHRFLKDPKLWPELAKSNPEILRDQFVVLPGAHLKVRADLVLSRFPCAQVVQAVNRVWRNNDAGPSWFQVYRDAVLFDSDRLRTDAGSEVNVQFQNKDILILGGDSRATLRTEHNKEEVNLTQGEAVVRAAHVKLVTPTAAIVPKQDPSYFKAKVKREGTSVQVEYGQTEVTSLGTGKSVIVKQGHANLVRANQDPGQPVPIPDLSELKLAQSILAAPPAVPRPQPAAPVVAQAPAAARLPVLRSADAPLSLDPVHRNPQWKKYKLQIARDPGFRTVERRYEGDMIPGRPVTAVDLDYRLPNGVYHRRAAYVDDSGRESRFYELPALELETRNPVLTLDAPDEGERTSRSFIVVRGRTEPGLILTVNGLPVEIRPDGSFYWGVVLKQRGPNKIQIAVKNLENASSELERTVLYTP